MMFKIQTPRLQILPLEDKDFPKAFEMMQNPEVMRYIGSGVKTEPEARTLFNLFLEHQKKFEFSLGKVLKRDTGEFLGLGGMVHFALEHDNPIIEIGYWLNPLYWGKGYATEIAKHCVDWAFQHLDIDHVVGVTQPGNAASQRVLQKAGLVPDEKTTYRGNPVHLFKRLRPEPIILFDEPPADFHPRVEVAACYVLAEGQILLLKCALGKPEEGLWGVPAGKINSDETPLQGALRELNEETGLNFSPSIVIEKGKTYIRKPSVDYIYHMFILPLNTKPVVTISSEHLEYRWISPQQVDTLPLMTGASQALLAAGIIS